MKTIAIALFALLAAGAASAQMTPVGTWRSIDDKSGGKSSGWFFGLF